MSKTAELPPCPLCHSTNVKEGVCYVESNPKEPAVRCDDCGCRATLKAWQSRRPAQGTEPLPLIDERLADLRKANDAFLAMSFDRSSDIQRNHSEIRWLDGFRSLLLRRAEAADGRGIECPNCHNANKYGDYEGPTCEVCMGDGFVPAQQMPEPTIPDLEGWNKVGVGTPINVWLETKLYTEDGFSESACRVTTIGDEPEWIARDGRTTVTHHSYAAPTHWRWPKPKAGSSSISSTDGGAKP